jgi:broad specificity phosphatase PhoE
MLSLFCCMRAAMKIVRRLGILGLLPFLISASFPEQTQAPNPKCTVAAFSNAISSQQSKDQIFILMRHANKTKGDNPSITKKGIARSQAAAAVIQEICKEFGKEKVQIVVSSLKRSQETGAAIAKALNIDPSSILQENSILERRSSMLSSNKKKNHPQYKKYKNLSKGEKFHTKKLPDMESGAEIHARMEKAINQCLDGQDEKTLTVFVSHAIAIGHFFKGLRNVRDNAVDDLFLIPSKYCEISIIERQGDQKKGYTWSAERRIRVL